CATSGDGPRPAPPRPRSRTRPGPAGLPWSSSPCSVDAEVVPGRGLGQRRELAQQLTLLARELLGDGHLEADQQVAAALAAAAGHAPAPDPAGAAGLGAGPGREGDRAAQ